MGGSYGFGLWYCLFWDAVCTNVVGNIVVDNLVGEVDMELVLGSFMSSTY
jgi:hypothetical protein